MRVIVDPFYSELGSRVILLGGFDSLSFDFKVFPDGEFYVRFLGDMTGLDVGLVMGCLPFHQSDCFLRSVFFVSTLRDLGANRVVVVFPYLPYGRQDKRFLPGECVSARIFVESLLRAGADVVATIDVHSQDVFSVFGDRFVNISSLPVWEEFLANRFGNGFFLVAPDKGRIDFISNLARTINVPYTAFRKVRDLKTGKIMSLEPISVSELKELSRSYDIAVVFDDIISTGGTMARAIRKLRELFNGRVVAAFTHGLFLPGSVQKLLDAGVSEIIATDTVKNSFAIVSVAKLIVDFFKSISHK